MSEQAAEKKERSLIPVNESGAIMPQNHEEMMRYAANLIKGKTVPAHLTTAEQVVGAWNLAAQLKLPPLPALRNIAMIQGCPSIFGDLPLALARRTGEIIHFEEFTFDKDYNRIVFENKNLDAEIFGAVCVIQRKDTQKNSYSFTVADAKRAGLWMKRSSSGKDTPWTHYPQVMITRRARAMALKAEFPDALMGTAIAEYDFHEAPDLKDVTHSSGPKESELNAVFSVPEDQEQTRQAGTIPQQEPAQSDPQVVEPDSSEPTHTPSDS